MFSFKNTEYNILEKNTGTREAMAKYQENYLIAQDVYNDNGIIRGGIIAILTPEEFDILGLTDYQAPEFF